MGSIYIIKSGFSRDRRPEKKHVLSAIKHWVLDSESGFFWIFMIFKENRSFPGTCPKNPGTYFLGRKKRLRQNCWEYSPFYKGLKMAEIVFQKMVFDVGLCGDGFGTFWVI